MKLLLTTLRFALVSWGTFFLVYYLGSILMSLR